jgi:probable F420-dependent oxidoreductase
MTLNFYLTCGFQPPLQTVEIARQAEILGFQGVALADHLFYPVEPSTPYPYTESGKPLFALDAPFPDVGVLMGALGAVTSALHFRTNVYILPLRHPLVAARSIGTAAAMAEGRVELGIGVGHLGDEFDALGVDFHTRGRRTDEAIVAFRSLLKSGPVSHRGDFWNIPPIYLHPAPEQPVPIFVGGESKAALARAARLGDGYVSVPHTLEDLRSLAAELQRLRADLAPDLPPLRLHMHGLDLQTTGDYRNLADIGVEAATIGFWRRGREPLPLDEQQDRISEFSESIIRKM